MIKSDFERRKVIGIRGDHYSSMDWVNLLRIINPNISTETYFGSFWYNPEIMSQVMMARLQQYEISISVLFTKAFIATGHLNENYMFYSVKTVL